MFITVYIVSRPTGEDTSHFLWQDLRGTVLNGTEENEQLQ